VEACGKDPSQCFAVPRFVAVNPYVAVMVQDREVIVTPGSTLRVAMRVAGKQPPDVMETLQVAKPFGGRLAPVRFDRTKADVLDLVLLGDEVVRW
jgi:hypothetical protein